MDTTAIERKLTALMEERGITRWELAEAIGVTNVTLSRWLNGQRQITVYALKRCAQYFGVTMDEIAKEM